MLTNPIRGLSRPHTDAVRQGRFNVTIVEDTLYKQLMSTLPDYMHAQIIQAYRFDDSAMKAELQQMLMRAVVEDVDAEILYA